MPKVHTFIYKMISVYEFDCANSIQNNNCHKMPVQVTFGKISWVMLVVMV